MVSNQWIKSTIKVKMIKIGSAGTSGMGYEDGLKYCKELGLDALEVEFTYGVKMTNSQAKKIGSLAKKLGISLSVHGPYYINLASLEKEKIVASKKRILDSCERAHYLGAKYVVFHAAFYQKYSKEECYSLVKDAIIDMNKVIKKWNVLLAPETTGKASQFGDVDELLRLHKETGCSLCIDFAHLEARYNKKVDYDELFSKLKLKHLHCHFSGIEYTAKGERRHLITSSDKIKELLKAIIKHKKDVTIINESPDTFGDCVKTLKILRGLR